MTTTELGPRAPRMAMGSLEDPEALGRVLAASGYFQDARDAAQAVVKVLAGAELGFGPIASMTGVYIVKGRVTLGANLMAAAIKRHPKYDYRVKDLTDAKAEVAFYERGQEIGSSEFTMDDAKRAGLANGENWKKYPRNMLLWRAMSNGAKFYCPDAFSGAPVYTPDELGADVDPESGEILNTTAFVDAVPVETPSSPKVQAVQAAMIAPPVETPMARASVTREDTSAMARASAPPVEQPTPKPEQPAPEQPAPAEPEQPAETPTPLEDPERPITPEEVAKLVAYLDELGAPESFRTMSRMAHGATSMDALTVGQAHEVMLTAKKRAGTAGWKAATT
jgi:hypothetical protein